MGKEKGIKTIHWFLVLFFWQSSPPLAAPLDLEKVESVSKSTGWQNLLYYKSSGRSRIISQRFFISTTGAKNRRNELLASLSAFKNQRFNNEGLSYQCLFPARYQFLKTRFPGVFTDLPCKELSEWKQSIQAGELYLVYASSYPSNPASAFGHTFLRFDRKSTQHSKVAQSLLGYSLAFQARTDPDDNPLTYTVKGLMGGYPAFLDIQPHYMNIGVYNNSESRDIWEYPIALSEYEKDFLLNHLWELSHSGAFSYYFFDDNCSGYMLRLLEAIRPEIKLTSKDHLFVVPQTAVREIVQKYKIKESFFYPSIERKIRHTVRGLKPQQQSLFRRAKKDKLTVSQLKHPAILNPLVDYWKYKNYQKKSQLSDDDKELMQATYLKRASLPTTAKTLTVEKPENESPERGHSFKRIHFGSSLKQVNLGLRFGFHDFFDPPTGFDQSSYISVLQLDHKQAQNSSETQFRLFDILSHQDFQRSLPKISWRAFGGHRFSSTPATSLNGLIGIGKNIRNFSGYLLVGALYLNEADFYGWHFNANIGGRWQFGTAWMSGFEVLTSPSETDLPIDTQFFIRNFSDKHQSSFGVRKQADAAVPYFSFAQFF